VDNDDQPKDADDVLSRRESVADEDEDEKMRPAGEAGRADEAETAKKRLDEDIEGDEPEGPVDADTGSQS
jgi:hypothetical protein